MGAISDTPLLPLTLSITLLLVAVIVTRFQPAWPLWLRVAWRLTVFVIVTLALQRLVGTPLSPNFKAIDSVEQFWVRIVEAGWWLLCAQVLIGFARLLVVLEHRPRETKIISDLLSGVIYVGALLAIVNFAFAVPIRGLLATSGVIAIILGLALQSTLADVFSGIAVGLDRPFKVGDLLWVEGGIEGRVMQVNWRSTQIVTAQNNIAAVPNNVIAKAHLINRSLPTPVRQEKVEVRLDGMAAPKACIEALTAAVKACQLLLAVPAPSVSCTGLHGDGNTYEITFSVENSEHLSAAKTELWSHLHVHLLYSGIALAVAGSATVAEVTVPTLSGMMEMSDLFSVIDPVQRDLLAQHLATVSLEPGETLILQGEVAARLFIVLKGVAEITVDRGDGPHVVHRLGPGETIGAMGLMTATPYAASATAITPMKAYWLDKSAIAEAIAVMPGLSLGLEELAKRGQEALRRDAAAPVTHELAHPEMFLARLRGFLNLLNK